MNNKEVIKRLEKLFILQDHASLAHLTANFIIDLNRFLYFADLTPVERRKLCKRVSRNMDQINRYLKKQSVDDKVEVMSLDTINDPLDEVEA